MVFFKFVRNKTGRKYFVMVKKKKPDETVVLITGASSGFGKATAELLADKGYRVYGTSRKPASENWPYTMLEMDVTKPLSIVPAISRIMEKEEGIDILINNAGFGVGGAVEETEWTLARKQFEVLLWGTLQVIRQVLPIMREHKRGLIINVSSIAGRMGLPYQGFYSSAKFALEGVTEALSMEVRPFGIKMVLVEPGDMHTEFTSRREWSVVENASSPYLEQLRKTRDIIVRNELNGGNPIKVARKIYCVIRKKYPGFRYVVGKPNEKLAVWLKGILPFRWFETILSYYYGIK